MSQKESVGFLCKLINEAVAKKANQKLKPFGLTQTQGQILGYLHERDGEVTSQKDIEVYFEVSHPTVVGILKRLEGNGFIHCEFDARDRRMKNVYLTEKEAALHAEMMQFRETTSKSLLTGFTDGEKRELLRLLHKVYDNIR